MSCRKHFATRNMTAALAVLGLACTLIVMEIQRLPVAHVVSFSMFAPVPYLAEALAVAVLGIASLRRSGAANGAAEKAAGDATGKTTGSAAESDAASSTGNAVGSAVGKVAALRWTVAAAAVASTWLLVWCAPAEDGALLAIRLFYRVSTGLLIVLWGERVLAFGARRAACVMAAACLASGALTTVLAVVPAPLMELVLGLLPLAAAVPLLILYAPGQVAAWGTKDRTGKAADEETAAETADTVAKTATGKACVAGKAQVNGAGGTTGATDPFLDAPLPSFDVGTPRDRAIMAGLIALPLICRGPMVAFQSAWLPLQQSAEAGMALQAIIGVGIMLGGLIVALIARYVWNHSFVLVFDLFVLPVSFVSFYTSSLTGTLWPLHLLIVDSTYKVCLFYLMMAPFLFAAPDVPPRTASPSVAPLCWFFALMIAVRAVFSGLAPALSDSAYVTVSVIVVLATFVGAGTLAFASVSRHLARRTPPTAPAMPLAPDELKARCVQLAAQFDLTPREHEILLLLAQHYRAPYIAEKLVVSQSTVKTHMRNLYGKLDVHSQAELLLLVEREPK